LYRLDGTSRISAAEWIEADGDEEARSKARAHYAAGRFEVWQSKRLIERA
jgi:hypothetical protein